MIVTSAAIRIVRPAIVRYTGSSTRVWKLSRLKVCSTSPLSGLTCQNAATRITKSEPR